jgi:hypothetical protein
LVGISVLLQKMAVSIWAELDARRVLDKRPEFAKRRISEAGAEAVRNSPSHP